MHGATQWAVMGASFVGNKIVLVAKFDAAEVWQLVGEEKVNLMMITGDAMARPLIDALEARRRRRTTCRRCSRSRQHGGAVLAVGEGRSSSTASRTS